MPPAASAGISEFLSTSATTDNKSAAELDEKPIHLVKLANEIEQQMLEKSPNPSASGIGPIGSAKVNVERMVYDFVTYDKNCAELPPLEVATIEKNVEAMHTSLTKYFKKSSYDLAKIKFCFSSFPSPAG